MLNVKGMLKNHALALSLGDAALGRFGQFLETKVAAAGGKVQRVGRFYPSTKTCSGCGKVRDEVDLAERTFVCPDCGLSLDRDYNAAVNILAEALRLSEGELELERRDTGSDETLNACGRRVRPTPLGAEALPNEAGTTQAYRKLWVLWSRISG